MAEPPLLPAHIEDTVQALVQLHAEHHKRATRFQRWVDRLTARAGRPRSLVLVTVVVVTWAALNVGLILAGGKPLDEPPFFWMQGIVALAALYMTVLVLTTQRREDELATRREQLTLQLAILSEQKAAKIISLLEELRQDHPGIRDRRDPVAAAMSTAADPQSVLDAIRDRHEALDVKDAPALVEPDLTSKARA